MAKRLRHGNCRLTGRTPAYKAWQNMIDRCRNPNTPNWHWYGARGIKVCERWKRFENFLDDMGACPSGRSLDRINNDGHYEPGNCRWATREEQDNNRRDSRIIEYRGERKTVKQWADALGLPYKRIEVRLRRGWSPERAFSEAPHPRPWLHRDLTTNTKA